MRTILFSSVVLFVSACGGESTGDLDLNVAWTFESGDCASNQVDKVKVTWGPAGGTMTDVEFACTAGQGKVGQFGMGGGSYGITAVGLDAAGVERFRHLGSTVTVGPRGNRGSPVELTLRPKPADVTVTWRGCPPSVVLPFFITIYRPPAMMGGALTQKVKDAQESCQSSTVTLTSIAPGSYVVELDSRAVTPAVRGTQTLTVTNGQNATVAFQLP